MKFKSKLVQCNIQRTARGHVVNIEDHINNLPTKKTGITYFCRMRSAYEIVSESKQSFVKSKFSNDLTYPKSISIDENEF